MVDFREEIKSDFKQQLEAKLIELQSSNTPEEEGQFFIEILKLTSACFLFLNKDSFPPSQKEKTERDIILAIKDLTEAVTEMDLDKYEHF